MSNHRKSTCSETCLAKPRYHEALMLRQKGMSYREIGEALGCSGPRAFKIIRKCLDEYNGQLEQVVAELREVEAVRLDRLQAAVWEKAIQGDDKAFNSVLRTIELRIKLFGLDMKPNQGNESNKMSLVFNVNLNSSSASA